MTLAAHRREIKRLQQRAARATTRLNKFTLKLALEGYDPKQNEQRWPYARARLFAVWELQDALKACTIKKFVDKATKA